MGHVRIVPFLNSGFQMNGKSALVNRGGGLKRRLPWFYSWSGCATVSPTQHVSFTTEFLGQIVFDTLRLENRTIPGVSTPAAASEAIGITGASGWAASQLDSNLSMVNGAFGIKVKLVGNLVAQSNLLIVRTAERN